MTPTVSFDESDIPKENLPKNDEKEIVQKNENDDFYCFDEKYKKDVEYLIATFGDHPFYHKIKYKKSSSPKNHKSLTTVARKKSKTPENTAEFHSLVPADFEIGFVDTLGRFYIYERGGKMFRDNSGNYFTKENNGFYDEAGIYYVFDDNFLRNGPNSRTSFEETYATIRALLDMSYSLPQVSLLKIPPTKRLYILLQSYFPQNDYSPVKCRPSSKKSSNSVQKVIEPDFGTAKFGVRNKEICEDFVENFLNSINNYSDHMQYEERVALLVSQFESQYADIVTPEDVILLLETLYEKCQNKIESKEQSSVFYNLAQKNEWTKIKMHCNKLLKKKKLTPSSTVEETKGDQPKVEVRIADFVQQQSLASISDAQLSDVAQASIKVPIFKQPIRMFARYGNTFDEIQHVDYYGPLVPQSTFQPADLQNVPQQYVPYNKNLVSEVVIKEVNDELVKAFKVLPPFKCPSLISNSKEEPSEVESKNKGCRMM